MSDKEFNETVERVIWRYLNKGQIDRALRVSDHFRYRPERAKWFGIG